MTKSHFPPFGQMIDLSGGFAEPFPKNETEAYAHSEGSNPEIPQIN